jgi:hypothetical protein
MYGRILCLVVSSLRKICGGNRGTPADDYANYGREEDVEARREAILAQMCPDA